MGTLHELRSDPTESIDVSVIYPSRASGMMAALRATEYTETYTPSLTGRAAQAERCGGICPWEPHGPNNFSYSVPRIYNNHEARQQYSPPHIVFSLVDDWGWNDWGERSDWLSWTTPTLDSLCHEGIELELHYSAWLCAPARASVLTGRYTSRTGFWSGIASLRLNETTIAQEMQTAGYKTAMVGKWHVGCSTWGEWPTYRGFDTFYGFMNKEIDYWDKTWSLSSEKFFDLQDGENLVSDPSEIATHTGMLFTAKAIGAMASHQNSYSSTNPKPLFLYYAPALVHSPWGVNPDVYSSRCRGFGASSYYDTAKSYCEMVVMLDDSLANITCALRRLGWADNTLLVLVSDNGGAAEFPGSSYPLRGQKSTLFNGGVRGNAFIHSPLIPLAARGSVFRGLAHLTDWLPTLMHVATNATWSGTKFNGDSVDGVDLWDSLMASRPGSNNYASPRTELLVNWDPDLSEGVILSTSQEGQLVWKLNYGLWDSGYSTMTLSTWQSLNSDDLYFCTNASLLDGEASTIHSSVQAENVQVEEAPSHMPSPVPSSSLSASQHSSPTSQPSAMSLRSHQLKSQSARKSSMGFAAGLVSLCALGVCVLRMKHKKSSQQVAPASSAALAKAGSAARVAPKVPIQSKPNDDGTGDECRPATVPVPATRHGSC